MPGTSSTKNGCRDAARDHRAGRRRRESGTTDRWPHTAGAGLAAGLPARTLRMPTDHYDRLKDMTIHTGPDELPIRLHPRQGQHFDADELQSCLEYTLSEAPRDGSVPPATGQIGARSSRPSSGSPRSSGGRRWMRSMPASCSRRRQRATTRYPQTSLPPPFRAPRTSAYNDALRPIAAVSHQHAVASTDVTAAAGARRCGSATIRTRHTRLRSVSAGPPRPGQSLTPHSAAGP